MYRLVRPAWIAGIQQFPKVTAALVISLGCLVLIGWMLDIDILKSILPNEVTMKPNTALCFILTGTALFLGESSGSPQRRWMAKTLSLIGFGLACVTLSQDLGGWNLGIDQLLFPEEPNPRQTLNPGRMSPLTAMSFMLINLSVWFKSRSSQRFSGRQILMINFCALITGLLSAQVIVGYFYRVHPIIALIPFTQMAIHTAVCFLFLSLALGLSYPQQGFVGVILADSAGGVVARQLLPAAIVIPLLIGLVRIETSRQGILDPAFGTSVSAVIHSLIATVLVVWNAKQLHRLDQQRQLAAQSLQQVNQALETKIAERTQELRQANAQLQQSEERLSLAIEGSGMATWDWDLTTNTVVWSPQHFYLLGYEPDPSGQASFEMWETRVHPQDLAAVMQAVEQAKQKQALYSSEYRICPLNSHQILWIRAFGRFFYNEAGQAMRFVGMMFDNTEKKQAQEERDRFFTLSLDMICIGGIDGYFRQLNPAWEKVLGYSQAELMAQPFLEFVHPEDREKTLIATQDFADGHPAIDFENRYRCQDGTYKWLAWTAIAAPESDLLYAVARDITARKQVEAQLAQQASTLKRQADLLELVYEAIIVRDAQGAITYWNQGAEAMYGWRREDVMGQGTHQLLQTQLPELIQELDQILLQQETWQGELSHTCYSGQQIIVESRQVVIKNEQGQAVGFLEVNRDVTQRKQTEIALQNLNRELERLLVESQTLLEVIPVGIGIASDRTCQQIRANPALAKLLGLATNQVNVSLGAPPPEKLNYEVYAQGRKLPVDELPMQSAANHGVEVLDLEMEIVRENGQQSTLLAYAAPLFDEVGNPRGAIGAFLDITERKQAEAEIKSLNATLEQRVEERTQQLQEANRDLEAFSYTVAHDLRAPLRGIQGFTQALLEDYGDRIDQMGQYYIQQIFSGTERMNDLVQDLLAYSRLSREQIKLAALRLNPVIEEAQAQVAVELQQSGAIVTIAQDLPVIMGYRPILVQMFVNLLSNAIKFVKPGVQPHVQIWAEPEQPMVRLWIADNGIGIAPDYQEQIFGVFERLHTREAYPGTGIGLAIVRKGAERLGGQAGVQSTPGEGSRFWILLQGAA